MNPTNIPDWLEHQTAHDLASVKRKTLEIEVGAGDMVRRCGALRRALRRVEQDLKYINDFGNGTVQRRNGGAR